ncbi:MAG: phosphate ABC transporter substrate-binding protein PstS [Candidatus Magnetominusculus sp. LBB02]|nr:phosphate ABC transporter substrate-binding protein PstS [Candidatus Magnetominusculus sp. LBB02]
MKKISMAVVFLFMVASLLICGLNSELRAEDVVKLQGAGATFPAPLYYKWFKAYSAAHKGVQVDYQSVGSGSGIKSAIDKTVDFAASDAAMTKEDMAKIEGGVQLLPVTAGSIVLSYNLEGIKDLKLPRDVYPDIFLGKITKWNDAKIAAANPGVKLPDMPINVVERSDGSGTTFVFSKHLSAISKEFEEKVGFKTTVNWPVGTRSKGNEGVTASIKTTPGAIGYIEYGFAMSQKMPMATLQNKSGGFVAASTASGQATLSTIKLPEDLIVWDSDPVGKEDYPIVTFTWLICYKHYADAKKADIIRDLLNYCLTDGQKDAEALGYIPLPADVAKKVAASIGNIK